MILYEVNLAVEKETAKDFEAWLSHHVDQVVELGKFERARWYSRNPSEEGLKDEGKVLWTIHYHAKDRATLDVYLKNHAPKLREEGLKKFPDKFSAARRILCLRR